MIHYSREHVPSAPESSGGVLLISKLQLVCSCLAMESYFMKLLCTVLVLMLLPKAVWSSVVSDEIEDR